MNFELRRPAIPKAFRRQCRNALAPELRPVLPLHSSNCVSFYRGLRQLPHRAIVVWPSRGMVRAYSAGSRSSRNRSCFNQIFYTAISTSWTLERGPCRKPSGGGSDRYSLSQKALRLISECSSTGTSFWLSQSGGSSGASDSWLETIRNRAKQAINVAIWCDFGAYRAVFPLNAYSGATRSPIPT